MWPLAAAAGAPGSSKNFYSTILYYNMEIITYLLIFQLCPLVSAFMLKNGLIYQKVKSSLSMSSSIPFSIQNALSAMPLCINPTSKTTTINDPTAGMTPDEIQIYMDNVGGGMCGYPEAIRTLIGTGLNLALLSFGLLIVTYAIVGGSEFFFKKQVDGVTKDFNSRAGFSDSDSPSSSVNDIISVEDRVASIIGSSSKGDSAGENRNTRRLKNRAKRGE